MLAQVRSATVVGLDAVAVDVEVDATPGIPAFAIVGLPDTAVREARERVRAAIRNAGYEMPARRITVNLASADTRKEGPAFVPLQPLMHAYVVGEPKASKKGDAFRVQIMQAK